MMSKKKLKPVDKPLPDQSIDLVREWHDVMQELQSESDRGAALMGAAYLDTALKSLIQANLAGGNVVVDKLLNVPNAPLGTFSSRIAMAYGLGLIGPNYFRTLESIREIRNAFAHFRRRFTFEDKEIKEMIESTFKIPYILPNPSPDLSLVRNRYIWTTAMILSFLTFKQEHAKPPDLPEDG
jgi:DNA-binding MltR family transcriptional regulator